MPLSDAVQALILNHLLRTDTWAKPSATWFGLVNINKGRWAATTAYIVGDFVVPNVLAGRAYKATAITTGNSGSSEPTWPTTDGGTVVDSGVTWTEQSLAFGAGTFPEVSGGSYARVQVTQLDANWSAPSVAGATANVNVLTYAAPTGNWGNIGFVTCSSANAAGTLFAWGALTSLFTVNSGNPAPQFAASAISWQLRDTPAIS